MIGKRQYSLSYLLLDIFWWAVALASVRAMDAGLGDSMGFALFFALFMLACTTMGAAVGGLFRQMFLGAGIGLAMVLWIVWVRS